MENKDEDMACATNGNQDTWGQSGERKKMRKLQIKWNGMNIIEMNVRSVFYSFQYLLK